MAPFAPEPAPPGLDALLGGGGELGGLPPELGAPPPPELEIPTEEPAPEEGGGDPAELVRQALDLLRQALAAEPDDEDTLLLEKMTTQGQQYLAAQQKLGDQAIGAGPGEKLVRKQTAAPAPPGGGGSY